jgi:hypothetical protein
MKQVLRIETSVLHKLLIVYPLLTSAADCTFQSIGRLLATRIRVTGTYACEGR